MDLRYKRGHIYFIGTYTDAACYVGLWWKPPLKSPQNRHKWEVNFVFECRARCFNYAYDIEANTGRITAVPPPPVLNMKKGKCKT
jgi:hypothetical protein